MVQTTCSQYSWLSNFTRYTLKSLQRIPVSFSNTSEGLQFHFSNSNFEQCELRFNCSLWEVFSHSLHICHLHTVSISYLSRDVGYSLHRCFDKVMVAIWWHFAFRGQTAVWAIRLNAEHYSLCTHRDWTSLKL